ncbi:MAG TPA: hypothetical protein VLK32_04045 [Bacillota bacterium]|nr:hypothetical protein [Bacillota bacterium]
MTLAGNHRTVLDLGLLADRAFVTGNGANMLLFGALYGGLATKVIFLQMLMGFGSREVGIYQMLPLRAPCCFPRWRSAC